MNDIKKSSTHKMELQISCSICTKVSSAGILWGKAESNRRSIAKAM